MLSSNLPFRPIQDIVVCRKDHTERLTAAGLLIPHVNDPDRQESDERDVAEVLGAGEGKLLADGKRRPMSVHVGDRIIFGRNKGQSIRLNELDYCVLREEHIIGRLTDDGFEPLNGVIAAQPIHEERELDSGVILPQSVDDRDEAIVVAVGPGDIGDDGELEPTTVRVGDRILYNVRMGEPFRHGERELVAMREKHIVCVVERADDA
jgi:chaperonin GroES